MSDSDILKIGSYSFSSRLLVGTGKYKDLKETGEAIKESGAEVVTVALRRTNIGQNPEEENLLEFIGPNHYTILPNTAGCYDAGFAFEKFPGLEQILLWNIFYLLQDFQRLFWQDLLQSHLLILLY